MRYKFKVADLAESILSALGSVPFSVVDTGDELIIDFPGVTLTSMQEAALVKLMAEKPLLRGRVARFVEKGEVLKPTPPSQ